MNLFTRIHIAENLRRALSATLCLAAASALCAADGGSGYRIGVLTGGTLKVKENALDAPWIAVSENVSSFSLEGDRIGVRKRDGSVLVKEGGLGAQWVRVAERTQSFALKGDRIAILTRRGSLDVKEGALGANWVRVAERTQNFQLNGRRIAVLMWGGALQLHEGSLDSNMTHVTDGVQSFQLFDQRIGVLYKNGAFEVKEGGSDAAGLRLAEGVQSFYLEGDRIGMLRNGALDVKEDALSAPWVRVADGVSSFKLKGDRIGVLQGGLLKVKTGGLNVGWIRVAEGVESFQLQGNRIIIQRTGGVLMGKDGGLDASWVPLAEGVQKFLIVHSGMAGSPTPSGGPVDWEKDSARGELTKTLVLDSSRGRFDNRSKEVEVLFPAGYSYCRHSLSANRRAGPGGVTIVSADPTRLVFGIWSAGSSNGSNPGGVQVTATVTGISDNQPDDSACAQLPEPGGGCGGQSCQRYVDAAESDNGMCHATSCSSGGRPEDQVCVYNLRADDQAKARARRMACREILNELIPNLSRPD